MGSAVGRAPCRASCHCQYLRHEFQIYAGAGMVARLSCGFVADAGDLRYSLLRVSTNIVALTLRGGSMAERDKKPVFRRPALARWLALVAALVPGTSAAA